ncbi:hypothetical protein P7H79_02355 [Lactococcus lactis]|uniref:hypothetical protein n=1 Tax=Lactococcus lactis TaxID=1358 RepID=UPI00288C9F1B|nr:hypothetical protein [Lactococcus lactis]MDT2872225.1 hypothetical protein [Lactococcus lactis]MDT2933726.1 hypothetical protein [Lactococcus lactis]
MFTRRNKLKLLKRMKKDKQIFFYLGMAIVILNNFFLSGFSAMLVSILGIAMVIYGVDDTE